jgi:hypothetical protein
MIHDLALFVKPISGSRVLEEMCDLRNERWLDAPSHTQHPTSHRMTSPSPPGHHVRGAKRPVSPSFHESTQFHGFRVHRIHISPRRSLSAGPDIWADITGGYSTEYAVLPGAQRLIYPFKIRTLWGRVENRRPGWLRGGRRNTGRDIIRVLTLLVCAFDQRHGEKPAIPRKVERRTG